MSMSVGASSSNALSYLQQLLHQGKAKSSEASKATDPLSVLMQSQSGGQTSGSQTGDATSKASPTSAGPSVPPIGADAMRMLVTVQGEETGNRAESKFFAKLDSDTTPASSSSNSNSNSNSNSSSSEGGGSDRSNFSKSASNMLEQLIKLQSQMLNAASSTLSALA